jgi:hypothetical protein
MNRIFHRGVHVKIKDNRNWACSKQNGQSDEIQRLRISSIFAFQMLPQEDQLDLLICGSAERNLLVRADNSREKIGIHLDHDRKDITTISFPFFPISGSPGKD